MLPPPTSYRRKLRPKARNFIWFQLNLCLTPKPLSRCIKVKQKIVEVCKKLRNAKMNLNLGRILITDMKAPSSPLGWQEKLHHSFHSQWNWTNSYKTAWVGGKCLHWEGRQGSLEGMVGWGAEAGASVCLSLLAGKKQGTVVFPEQR